VLHALSVSSWITWRIVEILSWEIIFSIFDPTVCYVSLRFAVVTLVRRPGASSSQMGGHIEFTALLILATVAFGCTACSCNRLTYWLHWSVARLRSCKSLRYSRNHPPFYKASKVYYRVHESRHWPLSRARWIQSKHSCIIPLRSISIYFCLFLCCPRCVLLSHKAIRFT
jgi:hypothetical protein